MESKNGKLELSAAYDFKGAGLDLVSAAEQILRSEKYID